MLLIWKECLPGAMGCKSPTYIAQTADGGRYTICPQPRGFRFSPGAGLVNDVDPFELAGYRVEWTSKDHRPRICEAPCSAPDHRYISNDLVSSLEEAKAMAERDHKQQDEPALCDRR
jgi:hypothetical protein